MFIRYSVIDMFGPFYGENWHAAEISDGLTFRWTGPEGDSSVRVPSLGALDIRLRWTFSFSPQEHQLSGLIWLVNGEEVRPHWSMRGAFSTLWADIHLPFLTPMIEVSLKIPPRSRTSSDVLDDPRTLGLAVHKLEVFALDPEVVGIQAQQLNQELRLREREIQDLVDSSSWKVTRPIRWLKQSLSGGRSRPHQKKGTERDLSG